jgi:hypothetical protein
VFSDDVMKYNKTCVNKKKYWTELQAHRKMRHMHKKGLIKSYYYVCPHCGAFHLTSNSKRSDFDYVILAPPAKKKVRLNSWKE